MSVTTVVLRAPAEHANRKSPGAPTQSSVVNHVRTEEMRCRRMPSRPAVLDHRTRTALDPDDWSALRAQGHRMLDDMLDHMSGLRQSPLWRDPDESPSASGSTAMPVAPSPLSAVHRRFVDDVMPFSSGNAHPGFMGWAQGGGAPVGMLAEMLAAGLNSNLGGRNHMALRIEREVLGWTRQLFGFPASAQGLFVTGASAANHISVLTARTRALGARVKACGLQGARLTAYTSTAAHVCVPKAMQMVGLGSDALRRIPVGADHRIDMAALVSAMARDRADGCTPFLLIGNAGTVGVGAVDDLASLADVARAHDMHFHVDGAFGALAAFSPTHKTLLEGIEKADSLAFDWHKWGQVPYECGYVLVRDAELMRTTFCEEADYLTRGAAGLAGGDTWPCDYGPDLSRGFKALKVWYMLQTYGAAALGRVVEHSCDLARHLATRLVATPELELRGPVPMNIVVFGWAGGGREDVEPHIVRTLQDEGRVAPSLIHLRGRPCIRACFINHRTELGDVDALLEGVLRIGRSLTDRKAVA